MAGKENGADEPLTEDNVETMAREEFAEEPPKMTGCPQANNLNQDVDELEKESDEEQVLDVAPEKTSVGLVCFGEEARYDKENGHKEGQDIRTEFDMRC